MGRRLSATSLCAISDYYFTLLKDRFQIKVFMDMNQKNIKAIMSNICLYLITNTILLMSIFHMNIYGQENSFKINNNCIEPDTSIIAWWSLDEADGITLNDIKNQNPGLCINGPIHKTGKVINALLFDGMNDYISIPDNDLWAFGRKNFTIEFWINFSSIGGGSIGHPGDVFISNNEGSGYRNKWFFAFGGGVLNFHVNGTDNNGFFPQIPFSPVLGEWYHLAITREANKFTIYINGSEKGSEIRDINIPNPDAPLVIGQSNEPFGGFFNGLLDEISIYNHSLSRTEILAIYSSGNEGKCKNLTITSDSILTVQIAKQFYFPFKASLGNPPYYWSISRGELPSNVTFNSEGILSGTPTEADEYNFTIRCTDNTNNISEKDFTLRVNVTLPKSDIMIKKTGTVAVPGRELDYFILVENKGETTAFNTEIGELLNPRQVRLLTVSPPAVAADSILAQASFILWIIPEIAPGEKKVLSYKVRLSPTTPLGETVSGGWICNGEQMADKLENCLMNLFETFTGCAECADECNISPVCITSCRIINPISITLCLTCLLPCIDCLLIGSTSGGQGGCLQDVGDAISCFADYFEECTSHNQQAIGPIDPNEKLVLAERYIQPNQILIYPIHFENVGEIEAKDIFITDTLDLNLDVNTLEIITQNGSSFSPVTRVVKWGLLNKNLLPQESDNVLFSIKPLQNLPSGTRIKNKANIQFEVFDIFTTNEVINIIDLDPPISNMNPLPNETTSSEFDISWTGTDAVGEIESYSIFVSTDNGAFLPYKLNTVETSLNFTGEPGRTYAFICIARDKAGNVEIKNPFAEASTKVILPSEYNLFQNYPNPFNTNTTIVYELPKPGRVTIKIFNLLGQEVKVIVDEIREAGRHKVSWSSKNFASGVYFYNIKSDNYYNTKKMVLVK